MAPSPPLMQWRDLAGPGNPVEVLSGRHDRSIPAHAHDFWELQLGERGGARHVTADGECHFGRGSIALLRPRTWHRKDACRGLVSWACCWPVSLLQGPLAHLAGDVRFTPLLHHHGAAWTVHLDEAATRRCLEHLAAIRGASRVARMARLELVLDMLASTCEPSATATVPTAALRALDVIDAQADRPWTVAGAARLAGLSPTHFARCCRAVTGRSPLAYLTHRRLERASALLLAGSSSIAEVAAASGFRDPDYFSRCFRRHRGCTPRAWAVRVRRPDRSDPAK